MPCFDLDSTPAAGPQLERGLTIEGPLQKSSLIRDEIDFGDLVCSDAALV